MSFTAITHTADETTNGETCAHCGIELPHPDAKKRWAPGTRIGLLKGAYCGPVAYAVGDKDTNPSCEVLP